MLGNPRTHVRNLFGNAGFAPVVTFKNLVATGVESLVGRVSGGKLSRSKSFVGLGKADRALLKAAWDDYADIEGTALSGGKYDDFANANKYIEEGRIIFGTTGFKPWDSTAGKLLEKARKGNSNALEAEDVWFSKPHYAAAMAQYCKINGITAEQLKQKKGLNAARAYAIREAQKATYRDTNALSQAISDLGHYSGDNKVKKGISILAEGLLPFRKTPANILARGIEYSPIGLSNGIKQALIDVRRDSSDPRHKSGAEAIDSISAGLTGTGLCALGLYMAAQGLVRGGGSGEEEKEKNFKDLMGHQAYSLEVGGTSVTLDWLSPECVPFFVGVNLWEHSDSNKVSLSDWFSVIKGAMEPLLEMSCLQSLNDAFEAVGYVSDSGMQGLPAALANTAFSYVSQGLPTIFGQVERITENQRYTSYTQDSPYLTEDMQRSLSKATTKLPGDFQQTPYIDAWGRKEITGTLGERIFNNFLNPSYVSQVKESRMEQELLRLYEATGEGGVFPSRAGWSFVVDTVEKNLTAEEYTKYATKKGQTAYQLLTDLTSSKAYTQMSDKEKLDAVKNAYDYANQTAKASVSKYEVDTWVKNMKFIKDECGISEGTFLALKSMTKDIEGLKYSDKVDKNGKPVTIDNSKGLLIMEKVYGSKLVTSLTSEQLKTLFEYLGVGKNVRHYNSSLVTQKLKNMRAKG